MRAVMIGTVVELDRNEWEMGGRSGVAFSVFVRADGQSEAQGATRVKVKPEQFGTFSKGARFVAVVECFANSVERQGVITGAKLSITYVEELAESELGVVLAEMLTPA